MTYKLHSFNVNGIRAIGKKGFWEWLETAQPDILAIQEIKADDEIMRGLLSGHPNINLTLLDNQITDPSINSSVAHKPQVLSLKTESGKILRFAQDDATKVNGLSLNDSGNLVSEKLSYYLFWHACSMKKGYSGTAIFFKPELFKNVEIFTGLGNPKFDVEGRITGLKTEHFTLINGYYPQGGREGRVSYKLEFYQELHNLVQRLENSGEKVILCGDFNTTLQDIDLARPKENRKTTGCLPEERVAFSWILKPEHFDASQLQITNPDFSYLNQDMISSLGFIDTFRHFFPDLKDKYSYWDQITRARERNVGWRIDYFNISPKLLPNLKSAQILDQVTGSDHCPVEVELEFK
jgi:exodeoxyribonuclease-3